MADERDLGRTQRMKDQEGVGLTTRMHACTDGDRVGDSRDYFPLDTSKWKQEPDLVPYAVGGGILVAVAGGIWYYRRKKA